MTATRAKGIAVSNLASAIASTIIQYSSGPASECVGYYFSLSFVLWDFIEWWYMFLFFPETKERTLEGMDEIFNAPSPVAKCLEKRSTETVLETLGVGDREPVV